MRQIEWTRLAKEDYFANIDYLIEKWTVLEAQNFIDDVNDIVFVLQQGNIDFQPTKYKDVRRCVIHSHISLFYRIIDKNHIELLRFWNNNQDDLKLKV